MKVTKEQLVEQLRARGEHDLADRLNLELPALVDPGDYPDLFGDRDLTAETGDAARHAEAGSEGDMQNLPRRNDD